MVLRNEKYLIERIKVLNAKSIHYEDMASYYRNKAQQLEKEIWDDSIEEMQEFERYVRAYNVFPEIKSGPFSREYEGI